MGWLGLLFLAFIIPIPTSIIVRIQYVQPTLSIRTYSTLLLTSCHLTLEIETIDQASTCSKSHPEVAAHHRHIM